MKKSNCNCPSSLPFDLLSTNGEHPVMTYVTNIYPDSSTFTAIFNKYGLMATSEDVQTPDGRELSITTLNENHSGLITAMVVSDDDAKDNLNFYFNEKLPSSEVNDSNKKEHIQSVYPIYDEGGNRIGHIDLQHDKVVID